MTDAELEAAMLAARDEIDRHLDAELAADPQRDERLLARILVAAAAYRAEQAQTGQIVLVLQYGTVYRMTKRNYARFLRAMADGNEPSPSSFGARDLGPATEVNNVNEARHLLGEEVD